MKFLHTSDWHLGKLFHEKSLVEDQDYVLNQIIKIVLDAENKNFPYSALVISGDIYDRALPPIEATTLLNNFLVKITNVAPELHIFINSGNHDSASRLSFAAEFLEKHNIHIKTDTKNIEKPVIIEQNSEKIAFYQLPFLTPLSIPSGTDEKQNRTQEELYSAALPKISKAHKKNYGSMPCVLNAHLFVAETELGSSERTNVGTIEQVSASLFSDFTYGAFGHIHKYQPCDKEKRCYYPGSLLAYNFDDSPKTGILEVEITEENPNPSVKRIEFSPLHPISKIRAKMEDLIGSNADEKIIKENKNNYVQVILTDEIMPTEAFSTLKNVFPNLLSVIMEKTAKNSKPASAIEQRKRAIDSNDPEKIFEQFMSDIGEDIESELVQKQKEIFVKEANKTE